MLKQKKPVLDEREMLEMYRIEHVGLWLMYGLLCGAVLVQLLAGAPLSQMAGELFVIVTVSVVMIIANARHGIWDADARPSMRGNAAYSVMAGVGVLAVLAALGKSALSALLAGVASGVLCFALLTLLMRYMKRRQEEQEKELESD